MLQQLYQPDLFMTFIGPVTGVVVILVFSSRRSAIEDIVVVLRRSIVGPVVVVPTIERLSLLSLCIYIRT